MFQGGIFIKILAFDSEFSILKLYSHKDADLSIPFSFLSVTDEEISFVCPSSSTPSNFVEKDDNWKGFRIIGILDFSLVGILAEISKILAENKIGIFAVSTYNTDYIFVKSKNFEKAISSLKEKGFDVSFNERV